MGLRVGGHQTGFSYQNSSFHNFAMICGFGIVAQSTVTLALYQFEINNYPFIAQTFKVFLFAIPL